MDSVLPISDYVTKLINLIVGRYLYQMYSICVIWNSKYDYNFGVINNEIQWIPQLVSLTNTVDLYDVMKNAMEKSSCEGFISFGHDIIPFLDAYNNASQESQHRFPSNHFIFLSDDENITPEYIFKHIVFRDLPDVLFIQEMENDTFNLWTTKFWGIENNTQPILLDIYNARNESFKNDANLYPDKITKQFGRRLIVSTFNYEPYMMMHEPGPNEKPTTRDVDGPIDNQLVLDGTEGIMMIIFCQKFNCSLELALDQEGEWGTLYDNYTGTGMFGSLINRKADVSIGALYLWHHEYIYMEFSKPITRTGITCLVPVPKRVASFLLPVQPFAYDMWIAVLISGVIGSIALDTTYNININVLKKHFDMIPPFLEGTETVIRTFLSQGINLRAEYLSIRILGASCLIIGLMMNNAYSGGLSSILTVPSYEDAIDNVQQIAERKLPWAATSPAWIYSIMDSPDPIIQKALSFFELFTEEEMSPKTKNGKYGFTLERLPYGHYAAGSHISSESLDYLQLMMTDIYYEYCVLMSFKTWSMLGLFDDLVLTIQASGIQSYWEEQTANKYLDNNVQKKIFVSRQKSSTGSNELDALSLNNILGMICMWGIGLTASIIAFIIEISIAKKPIKN